MARKRTPRSEGTRHRIIEAAADAFGEVGYEETALDEIARRASVTKATLYYHFDSKEELYAEALIRVMTVFRDRLAEEMGRSGTPRAKLERMIWFSLEYNSSPVRRFIPLPRPGLVAADVRRAISALRREYEELVAAVIREGQASGELRPTGDATLIARILITAIGRVARWFNPAGETTLPEMYAIVCSLCLDGLATPSPARANRPVRAGA